MNDIIKHKKTLAIRQNKWKIGYVSLDCDGNGHYATSIGKIPAKTVLHIVFPLGIFLVEMSFMYLAQQRDIKAFLSVKCIKLCIQGQHNGKIVGEVETDIGIGSRWGTGAAAG